MIYVRYAACRVPLFLTALGVNFGHSLRSCFPATAEVIKAPAPAETKIASAGAGSKMSLFNSVYSNRYEYFASRSVNDEPLRSGATFMRAASKQRH